MSHVPSDADSWSASLEQWASHGLTSRADAAPRTFPFAPKHAPRPRFYDDVPVVLIVATGATAHLHQGLLDGLRLVQEATYGFRPLLITDDVCSPVLDDYDWAVEHIMAEDDWHRLSARNWLTMAAEQLTWARRHYGADVACAPSTREESVAAVLDLARRFRAPRKVREAAGQLADTATDPGGTVRGLRGWWQQLEPGSRDMPVQVAGRVLDVAVHRGHEGLMLATDPGTRAVLEPARAQGWSTVGVDADPELWQRTVLAARDGLGGRGPTMLAVDGDTEPAGWQDIVDGLLVAGRGLDEHTVRMSYGVSLTFRPDELSTVLDGIREVHRRSTPPARTAGYGITHRS